MKSKVFKVFWVLMALASVSFLLHFWGFEKNNSQPVIYAFPGKERPVSNVWTSGEKGYLWVNPVNIKYYEIKKPNNVRIHYCQISGLRDYRVQQAINDDIYRSVLQCSNGEFNGKKGGHRKEVSVSASVPTVNCNNIICLDIFRWGDSMEQPHLWLTYDLKSGKRLSLKDIFADGVDYRSIINRKISEQIWRDGLEETRLKRPFAGIDSNQLFYITPDALVIVFPAQNPYFKYTYDYEVKGNHFFRFFIPFYELPDATIFDKYWTERSIFFRPFTLKQTLPNKLKTIYKQKKIVKDLYEVRVGYYEIQGYKDPAIQEKINQIMLKQAERLLVDERFDHIDKPDGWKKFYKEVIPGLRGNVGGYIGISYFTTGHFPPGWEKREEDEGAWYFDLRTGKEFKLEDLFNSRERCIQVIDREIRENYKYDDFEGFEHYIDKVPFAFDMTRLYITFPYDDPYFKNKSRSIRIPYERFKLDDLKLF